MSDLALYLAMAVVGFFCGSRLREHQRLIQWTGRLQTVAIIILIFAMGMRMGSNQEVIDNLNSIGLYALIMTISIIIFSVAAMTGARKIMRIDRFGNLRDKQASAPEDSQDAGSEESNEKKLNSMTVIILLCVAGGLAFGHFIVPEIFSDMEAFGGLVGTMINVGLCVLLYFVGFDMGVDGTVMLGTLVGAAVCVPFLSWISLREALAIGGGFGWYTFAPGIIMEAGLVTASAVSFMHNVMREFISVLIIPLVAKKIGYLEAMAVPACSSMDVCLPLIERSTRGDIAMYSFISGVVQSAAVPIVVPLVLGY